MFKIQTMEINEEHLSEIYHSATLLHETLDIKAILIETLSKSSSLHGAVLFSSHIVADYDTFL